MVEFSEHCVFHYVQHNVNHIMVMPKAKDFLEESNSFSEAGNDRKLVRTSDSESSLEKFITQDKSTLILILF